jgi:4-diphosphocytidyl-2-C-methyl-D-erythritol kinase
MCAWVHCVLPNVRLGALRPASPYIARMLEALRAAATAKLNLALVVGPRRAGGLHDITTVLQRLDLVDRVVLAPAANLAVTGFEGDTLVRDALTALAERAGVKPAWHVHLVKRIPIAAGLGGGSSDAATALRLANETLEQALEATELHTVAAAIGVDAPFFLTQGPQLGEGDGTQLSPLRLPGDYWVLLVLPHGSGKLSTAAVYRAFDDRRGEHGADKRRTQLLQALGAVSRARDLAELPPNDLASSPIAGELRALGAFRADVTGAGPVVYGLFQQRADALAARTRMRRRGRTWLTVPAWYG